MFSIDQVEEFGARPVTFHCPACGGRGSAGVAWCRRESRWILGVIPVFSWTTYWVRGECCRRDVLSAWSPDRLAELDPDETETRGLVQRNLSVLALALTAVGFVLCFVPGLCFAFQAWALVLNRREAWWVRGINIAGLVLGAAVSLLQLYWYATDQ